MRTRGCACTTLQIWELMSALHRIATGEELTMEQAGEYFSNPKLLLKSFDQLGR